MVLLSLLKELECIGNVYLTVFHNKYILLMIIHRNITASKHLFMKNKSIHLTKSRLATLTRISAHYVFLPLHEKPLSRDFHIIYFFFLKLTLRNQNRNATQSTIIHTALFFIIFCLLPAVASVVPFVTFNILPFGGI